MNNNREQILFIAMLIEEEHNRNYMRIVRRNLRDTMNPFEMPSTHFRQMFRLDKISSHNLIESLRDHIVETSIPIHLKIFATLNFLAVGSYQNSVGCNSWISLSQSSISKIIFEVCNAMSNNLLRQWIKFPITLEENIIVKQGFFEKWGARGVLGVIDGTHVDILAPPMNDNIHPPFVYINRKGKHSINVMLISDSNSKIIACNARYPGSVHDAAIWQLSNIRRYLMTKYENGDNSTHLIGDSGYPLEPWLFTPFAAVQDGSSEALFNNELTSVRNVIERTNGILKGRFRCLSKQRMLMYHPVRAACIINTACILHNMALAANIQLPEEEIEYRENDNDHHLNQDVGVRNDLYLQGRAARNSYIVNNIIN